MLLHLFNSVMRAAETGMLPDVAVRFGIRKLLKQRLKSISGGHCEVRNERFRQFLADCSSSPVAVVPELANEQHYEVPAEFFRTVLGSRLKYSCCHFPDAATTLDKAEESALMITCERAGIEDGMDILELGCGWGSLSLWMAEKFPLARIQSISNSTSQRMFIQQQADATGLTNLRVVTADMNEYTTDQTFDRVVSVEMFEHMRNHRELMRRISTWLKPQGRLFVHVFCHSSDPYLFESSGPQDWMARHFFSGGMMPSDDLLLHCQRDLAIVDHWQWDGRHYERTCNEWLKKQDADRSALRILFAETYGERNADLWLNRWRIFFMACAELFGYRAGSEWLVSHYLFEKSSSPTLANRMNWGSKERSEKTPDLRRRRETQ